MSVWRRLSGFRDRQELPAEIYISLVDSLFSDARSLFAGSLAVSLAVFVTAWKAGEPSLYLCALATAAVAFARARDMRTYARLRPNLSGPEAIGRWEDRYVIGSLVQVALLGLWCVLAFTRTSDPFVHLVSLASTIAYMVGISGRNFSSRRLVAQQILSAGVPITLALISLANVYYVLFALLLVAFFYSLKSISDRLRRTLLDAVMANRANALLAARFDTALNNMPHGLCMFDARQRLAVYNGRLLDMLGLPAGLDRRGATAQDLLSEACRDGSLLDCDDEGTLMRFADGMRGEAGDLSLRTKDDRDLAVQFHQMENGGSVVLVEDITDRKKAEARIASLARYDTLTGLPNRKVLHDQMESALAAARLEDGRLAVLFIDLDHFKQVNDTLGHPVGDQLLCAVSDRLRGIVEQPGTVARFGGDEFVVLKPAVSGGDEASYLARQIVETLRMPYEIGGHRLIVGASIGIAMAPGDGVEADQLLKNADMALYRAKSDGRGAWRFFEPEMDIKAQARRNLELDLRSALSGNALQVFYQPLYNLKSRSFSTCEALLRWPHPGRGMISPAEFIPIAEEMGLIVEIGNWVLRQACIECTRWPRDVRVAVNLSPVQFKWTNVVAAVREALAESGLAPDRLELEITETVLLQDMQATRIALHHLREIGTRVALDDFGTGYSSLSYLHRFPFHKVKIDRSFLQGLGGNDRALTLLRGVARLNAELGMAVAVEGVETREQLELIARDGNVDEVQGFLFSPAIPAHALRTLLYASAGVEKVA